MIGAKDDLMLNQGREADIGERPAALSSGAPALYQAYLTLDGWKVCADFLIR